MTVSLRYGLGIALACCVAATCGCATSSFSDTKRTGVEQLLLSTAADRAVAEMSFTALSGRNVMLDVAQLEAEDKGYVVNALRARLLEEGARLVPFPEEADVIVEAGSGAMATDSSSSLIGIPAIPIVIFSTTTQTPELPLFKSVYQVGTAKLHLHAHDARTGEHILSVGPALGRAYYNRYTILVVLFRRTDIPGI